MKMNENVFDPFYDQIWSLTNLTYFNLYISYTSENYFPNPRVISRSLRFLLIKNTPCSLSILKVLCQHNTCCSLSLNDSIKDSFLCPYKWSTNVSVCQLYIISLGKRRKIISVVIMNRNCILTSINNLQTISVHCDRCGI